MANEGIYAACGVGQCTEEAAEKKNDQRMPKMAVFKYVDFCNEQSQRLADLAGIAYDLELVRDFCGHFLDCEANSKAEGDEMIAYCTSALIFYGRTMATGVRSGITTDQLVRLPAEMQETHKYIKDVRDKFVAHSVNAFEENRVVAYLEPEERGPRSVRSISTQHGRVMMLSGQRMEDLRLLALRLLEIVSADANEEKERVLAYAKTLPVDGFYDEGEVVAINPGKGKPEVARSKFK